MHIAQFNISKERYPLTHAEMRDFVEQLAIVNAMADGWDGFVWRLHDESGNATGIRTFEDPRIIFNLSVWESIETLRCFTFRSGHAEMLRKRRRWFLPLDLPSYVLWWVEEGSLPSLEEAKSRLRYLQERGPSKRGFTFASVPREVVLDG
jgi:hypothetical protein